VRGPMPKPRQVWTTRFRDRWEEWSVVCTTCKELHCDQRWVYHERAYLRPGLLALGSKVKVSAKPGVSGL